MSPQPVQITAPSRLHFGMLSFGQPNTRQFGGAGVMISQPQLRLTITPAERLGVEGPLAERVTPFLGHLAQNAPWWPPVPRCRILIDAAPPQHSGLGSGTQLGMALGLGLARFFDAPPQTAAELARAVGRGKRSAIGAHGALVGGLLVESGKRSTDELSPLICRIELPEAWRFVLVIPQGETGLSGEAEQQAFDRLPPVSPATTAALCRELLTELLPAAVEADFERFGESVYRFGRMAGGCFAARQGGVYASPAIERVVDRCRREGIRGVGQSSWGPTVYALCPAQSVAEALAAQLAESAEAASATIVTAGPCNQGSQAGNYRFAT